MAERTRNHTKFARTLNELGDEELIEAARQVAPVMDTQGWAFVRDLLTAQYQQRLDGLVSHAVPRTEAEYAAVLGEARGIQIALDAGQTVLDKAEAAIERIRQQGTA
jgi:hypothetical protein